MSVYPATEELASLSRGHHSARADARTELEKQIRRAKASGMILHSFDVRFEQEEGYYWVEVDAFASAIVAGPATARTRPPSTLAVVPVIRLDGKEQR